MFKTYQGDLSQTLPNEHVVTSQSHQTHKHFLLKKYLLTVGNQKSPSGKLQNSRQLQSTCAGGAMLITMKRMIVYNNLSRLLCIVFNFNRDIE